MAQIAEEKAMRFLLDKAQQSPKLTKAALPLEAEEKE